MVTRKLSTPSLLVVGLSVGLLAQDAIADEIPVVTQPPVALTPVAFDDLAFRREIDSYIRSLNEQLRRTLERDLHRSLAPSVELASNELRARG